MTKIVHLSDCHVGIHRNNLNLIAAIRNIKRMSYDCVIVTGDIAANGLLSEYLVFDYITSGLKNLFVLAGNHDNTHNMKKIFTPKQMANFYINNYYVQLINSKIDNKITGFIDINIIQNIKNSIVFTHHPILNMQEKFWDDNLSINNMIKVQKFIAQTNNIKMVGFGHAHIAKDFFINNTLVYSCPSTAHNANIKKISGFNAYELYDKRINKKTILIHEE